MVPIYCTFWMPCQSARDHAIVTVSTEVPDRLEQADVKEKTLEPRDNLETEVGPGEGGISSCCNHKYIYAVFISTLNTSTGFPQNCLCKQGYCAIAHPGSLFMI